MIFANEMIKLAIWLMVVPIALLILVSIVVAIVKAVKIFKTKKGKETFDFSQQVEFLEAYGSKDNIVNVSLEMSRIRVEVKNLEAVNLQKLKDLGATGVLVMGNFITASFQERSNQIYEMLK